MTTAYLIVHNPFKSEEHKNDHAAGGPYHQYLTYYPGLKWSLTPDPYKAAWLEKDVAEETLAHLQDTGWADGKPLYVEEHMFE